MSDAKLLERILAGDDADEVDLTDEVGDLVVLAQALQASSIEDPPTMRAEARQALRNDLVRTANSRREAPAPLLTRLRERITATTDGWAYSARVAGVSSMAAAVLSGGGVAAAASGSVPGDPFYGLKRTVEDVVLSFSDAGMPRGAQLMEQALSRIDEAGRAAAGGNDTAAAAALTAADTQVREGAQEFFTLYIETGDTGVLRELGGHVVVINEALDGLGLDGVSSPAGLAVADLRTSLNRIGQRIEVLATGACTSCDLGVHDSADDPTGTARGGEADGTPPLPGAAVDLTFIPPADQPFQACPCVDPVGPGRSVAPPARPTPGATEPDPPAQPAPTGGPGAGGSGGGSGGGGSGGGGGGTSPLPIPVPEPGPGPADPVRDAVEEIIEGLPDGPGASAPDL